VKEKVKKRKHLKKRLKQPKKKAVLKSHFNKLALKKKSINLKKLSRIANRIFLPQKLF